MRDSFRRYLEDFFRVPAVFFAALFAPVGFFAPVDFLAPPEVFARVVAAFFADAERSLAVRLLAAVFACRDRAACEAALLPSFFRALVVARERLAETFRAPFVFPLRKSF